MSGYCLDCGNNPCICEDIEDSKLAYKLMQQSRFKEIDIYYVDELQDQIKRLTNQLEKAEVISNKKDEVINKLIQLLLLTDYSVSNFAIGDVQFIQWHSFTMDFPEYLERTPSGFLSSHANF